MGAQRCSGGFAVGAGDGNPNGISRTFAPSKLYLADNFRGHCLSGMVEIRVLGNARACDAHVERAFEFIGIEEHLGALLLEFLSSSLGGLGCLPCRDHEF